MSLKGSFPHALLITGEAGSGKKTAAKYFSMACLCKNESGPCFSCSSCKKILSGNHPDLKNLTPTGGLYKVQEMRDLRSDTVIAPNESERKIYVIDGADKMNESAANSLLKCLEEPPKGVVFVLLAEDEKGLLSTILSRTVRFRVAPLSEDIFVSLFGEEGYELYQKSNGNLGLAEALRQSNEKGAYELAEEFLSFAFSGSSYETIKFIKQTNLKKPELLEFLGATQTILKNVIIAKAMGEYKSVSEEKIGKLITEKKALRLTGEILPLRDMANRNVLCESILFALYFKIKG